MNNISRSTLLLTTILALLTGCRNTVITTGDLRMEINRHMQVTLLSEADGAAALMRTPQSTDALFASEQAFCDFTTKQVIWLADTACTIIGEAGNNGFCVEKHQTLCWSPAWENMVTQATFYVNKGKTLTVTGYQSNALALQANDTVVWSFQPSSTSARADWMLPITEGFSQRNYLGMNNCDYGGGIPMIDLWRRDAGITIGITEPTLQLASMPVVWTRYDDCVRFSLQYTFEDQLLMQTNDTVHTFGTFMAIHQGDFYNALQLYSNYMQAQQNVRFQPSEPEAFEPVWCAWGYERTFTLSEVIGTLDKVAELGFRWVDVDDGFQIAEGDWETNSRFPGGDNDMKRLADEIHRRGMYAKLWWAPLAADPGTQALLQHPEMLLRTKEYAPEYITWWDSWYLSPVNPVTWQYTADLVDRFLNVWDFDGLKIDGQHLNCCMPDYNDASGLDYPEQAVEQMPLFFKNIYEQARQLKPHAVVQVCPCGCAVNFFHLPYFNQSVASDPTSSAQVRMKRKAYAAMCPQLAYYADHVELTDGGDDFATQIGIGGVIGTKFTYPKDNPNASESFLLTPEREQLVRKWMNIYQTHRLSTGDYLNLYDLGFDYPEAHVIRQNGSVYYAFYAPEFDGEICLKGLDPDKRYAVCTYTDDCPTTTEIDGSHPYIQVAFQRNRLIKVTEL